MKPAELAKPAHARRHAAKPLQRVKIMQALVEQHAAAFTFPSGPPAAARIIGLRAIPVGVDPVDADDPAQVFPDELLDFQVTRFRAQLKHAGENNLRKIFMFGDQPFGIRLMR